MHFFRLYKMKFKLVRDNKFVYYFRILDNSFKNALLGFKEQKFISLKSNGPKLKIYYIYFSSVIKFIVKFKILKFISKI